MLEFASTETFENESYIIIRSCQRSGFEYVVYSKIRHSDFQWRMNTN